MPYRLFFAAVTLAAGLSYKTASAGPAATPEPVPAGRGSAPLAVKVMIVNLFSLEAWPWLEALTPTIDLPVRGLPADSPAVHCTIEGVCQMTTDMGHANAAASVMAVLLSGKLDLRQAYFLVAGIAGIDPARGTIGTAAWARYVVDSGIAHEIDARELPPGWEDGYFGVFTDSPGQSPKFEYHSELFQLDEALLQRAVELSKHVALGDSADARAYRKHYPDAPANRPPTVIQCDTLSADTWWVGHHLEAHARRWTQLLTGGKGVYCTSQQEDNAVMTALARGALADLVDLRRVAIVRGGADFDRPYPNQGTLQSLQQQRALPDAAKMTAQNLVLAGMPLVREIVGRWDEWRTGVPAAGAPAAGGK